MDEANILERANELYWGSNLSVNAIAEKMDVSKSRLYGLIDAQPAGGSCPACGAEADFPNRTAKDKGIVRCGSCDWEGTTSDLTPLHGSSEVVGSAIGAAVEQMWKPSNRIVWAGVLLGAAAGLYLYRRGRDA